MFGNMLHITHCARLWGRQAEVRTGFLPSKNFRRLSLSTRAAKGLNNTRHHVNQVKTVKVISNFRRIWDHHGMSVQAFCGKHMGRNLKNWGLHGRVFQWEYDNGSSHLRILIRRWRVEWTCLERWEAQRSRRTQHLSRCRPNKNIRRKYWSSSLSQVFW